MLKRLAFAMVVSLALGLSACGSSQGAAPPPAMATPLMEKPLPHFKRPALDGSTVNTETVQSKTVVVKFFAKYCEPCKRTLPAIQKLHADNPDVTVIGIAEDEKESEAREVVQQYGLTFPVVHDKSNVLSGRYRVSDLPVTFVAKGGVIKWAGGSNQSETDLENAIKALSE